MSIEKEGNFKAMTFSGLVFCFVLLFCFLFLLLLFYKDLAAVILLSSSLCCSLNIITCFDNTYAFLKTRSVLDTSPTLISIDNTYTTDSNF